MEGVWELVRGVMDIIIVPGVMTLQCSCVHGTVIIMCSLLPVSMSLYVGYIGSVLDQS